MGPATAAKLKGLHLKVDLMPETFTAAGVAQAFADSEDFNIENENICLVRAEVANPELPKALEALGAIVDDIPVYRTVPETEDRNGAVVRMEEEGADWITFASSSAAENFDDRFGLKETLERHSMQPVSIGPETTKTDTGHNKNPLHYAPRIPIISFSMHQLSGVLESTGCYPGSLDYLWMHLVY